jgi:transcription initiation factor TFIIE subunit alpha
MVKEKSSKKNNEKFEVIAEVISHIAGKNSRVVLECLFNKKDVNEFLIAKKTELTINQIRNVLYKLSEEGLVSFIRKKDKKKGWYTYFWTFDSEKSFIMLRKIIEKEIAQLESQLKSRETKQFYCCKICNFEITEENALLHEYTCPECGEIYELHDNQKQIKDLNNAIEKMKRKLNDIGSEIEVMEQKRKVVKIRSDKKQDLKIKKERMEKRKNSKIKKETIEKTTKEKVKKQPGKKKNLKITKEKKEKIKKNSKK